MYFPGFPPVMPMMKAGTVKVLAVSSVKRSDAAPDIPTVAEATGFPDFDFTLWQGFFAPKATPVEVIARLNSEINKILADPASDRVLGMHILGPRASDLIAEGALAIEFEGAAEDIGRSVHAHPTLPEAVKEAALAVGGRAIHF